MATRTKAPKKVTNVTSTPAAEQFQTAEMKRETEHMLKNGLGDALGFPGSGGFEVGGSWGSQLSQVSTLFKNNRWYLISNMRQLLAELYVEHGLVQTIVDVPVEDGLRGGVDVTSAELDEDEIKQLQIALDRDNDLVVVGQAAKWNRLFGGAGIVVMTDQPADTELNLEAIGPDTPLEFKAVDMWELFYDKQNDVDGEGGLDPVVQANKVELYNYYGKMLHRSRVMLMKGITAPSFIRPRLRGWGFSVVESLVRSINQYLKANDLGFEVLDEFKLDVFKIKNLTNTLLSPKGEAAIKQRMAIANWQKNYQNALVMDSEDDFDHKQLSFSGLAETMTGIRMQIASDMRMPMTKLFGISAAGFNSGEDDIEVYNAMVESQVRTKIKRDVLRVIEIKCQKLFGFVPEDLAITFKPLRVMSSEQEETVKTAKFNRLLAAKTAGEITRFEFREGCNKDNLLTVSLDTSGDKLNPDDPEIEDVLSGKTADVDTNGDDAPEGSDDKAGESKDAPKAKDTKPGKDAKPAKDTKPAKDPKPTKNSDDYDKSAYEMDGGQDQFSAWHERQVENPDPFQIDIALMKKAREASWRILGRDEWQFALWYYKKQKGNA